MISETLNCGAIVTTSQKGKGDLIPRAKGAAKLLRIPYVERKRLSLANLQANHKNKDILIFSQKGPQLFTGEGKAHEFHLSMAQLRSSLMTEAKPIIWWKLSAPKRYHRF